MQQVTASIQVSTQGRRLYDISAQVAAHVKQSGLQTGLLTLYIQHTSASLLINENYDQDVLVDMEAFFNRLVPDGDPLFVHTVEGPDDMPAHIRSALTQTHFGVASSLSASQTLITDCLVTPSLLASRSSDSIIHKGKSTFTRLCACCTRLALDTSNEDVMSSPSSNC